MKRKNFAVFLGTLKKSAVLLVVAGVLIAVFVLKANANEAQVLVRNGNSVDANLVSFKRVEYVGQCPGEVITPGTRNARFTSSSTPPAPGRRVIIKNVSEGMSSNPYPYTERSYDRDRYSESFDFGVDNRHHGSSFSVLQGDNQFKYEIQQGSKVIEQGEFTATVSVQDVGVFPRQAICQEENDCYDESYEYDCDKEKIGSYRSHTRRVCNPLTKCTCPS